MKLRLLKSKRVITVTASTLSLAVLSIFGAGPLGVPYLVGQAHAAGCTYIDNDATQSEITGNGVNNPVTITANGNCFHVTHSGTWNGYTWDMWQNDSGHCLWSNGPTLEVGAACANDNNHPNEEFFGVNLNSQGWTWSNVTNFYSGGGAGFDPSSCSRNSTVTLKVYSPCPRWHFLSP